VSVKNSYIPHVFGQIGYLITESFRGWKQHFTVIAPSLMTVFLCSLLLSGSLVGLLGMFRATKMERSLYTAEVFLKEPLSPDSLAQLALRLQSIKQIDSVEYVSPETALRDFKEQFSGEMLALVSGNPLPPSFRLSLRPRYQTLHSFHEVHGILLREYDFDAVQSPLSWVERVDAWKSTLFFWFPCISVLMFFTVALIIRNAVKLSLFSRKLLVENMKYAGGSSFFIGFPFVLEGVMLGFLGSTAASVVALFLIGFLQEQMPVLIPFTGGFGTILFLQMLLVTLFSAFSSFSSVRGFLRRHDREY
jgi:cell division transport system permease protein